MHKLFIASFILALVPLGWGSSGFGQETPTPRGELRVVDPQTIRFHFPEPDGLALAKLSLMHMGNRQFYREFGWGEARW
jgi:hypothetical protein